MNPQTPLQDRVQTLHALGLRGEALRSHPLLSGIFGPNPIQRLPRPPVRTLPHPPAYQPRPTGVRVLPHVNTTPQKPNLAAGPPPPY